MKLGIYDVESMLNDMSSSQLLSWLHFYNDEPWGYEVDNIRFGVVASAMMNSQRGKSSDKVYTWKDFFTPSIAQNNSQTPEEQYRIASLFCAVGKE